MLEFSFVRGDELPHRVVINNLRGAGQTKSDAVLAALSAGKIFPFELGRNKKAVANYLFWNYYSNPDWLQLVSILEKGE